MGEKIACTGCGALILVATAEANGGLCTPCKRGPRKNIEDAKLRHAERKKAEAKPDPAAKHWRWLVSQVYHSADGFAGLSEENQMYFAACLLESEFYNGGFDQYFGNSSADYYGYAVRGLEAFGAAECCRILLAAKQALFGARAVPDTQAARLSHIGSMAPAQEKELGELDRLFGQETAGLRDLVARYARRHGLYDGF